MPIKPENAHLYPPDWSERSRAAIERDGNRCRFCGAPNGQWIERCIDCPALWRRCEVKDLIVVSDPEIYEQPIKIVLTAAHLDPSYNLDDIAFLAACCQRCHFTLDKALSAVRRNGMQYALVPNGAAVPSSWAENPCVKKIEGR
jgi:hypothetical protein